ncbi:MAG: hypothetical protein ACD_12C00686G0003 [uncultured bacterium]|nr:MAG: hypothetical protein ACD_12C00686G0003 [uncultured bacterium]
MKIFIKKSFKENIPNLIRHLGYHENRSRFSQGLNFVRTVSRGFYPRFHLYINQATEEELELNLHLDQKKSSYPGTHAHAGDYDTEVVKEEAERIKNILERL